MTTTVTPEDCPCCGIDEGCDLHRGAVAAFLGGYAAGRGRQEIAETLCQRHLDLAQDALAFMAKVGVVLEEPEAN